MQREICTQLYVVGAANSVLIREVFFIQSVLYREVPLYYFVPGCLSLSCYGCPCPPSPVSAPPTLQG